MVMTSDETQIQISANGPMSHAKRVTRDNRKNPEYRVIAAIRKLRTDKLSRLFVFRALALRQSESNVVLTLETPAFESLYDGQFTLSIQKIKPNYLVILRTDAAP